MKIPSRRGQTTWNKTERNNSAVVGQGLVLPQQMYIIISLSCFVDMKSLPGRSKLYATHKHIDSDLLEWEGCWCWLPIYLTTKQSAECSPAGHSLFEQLLQNLSLSTPGWDIVFRALTCCGSFAWQRNKAILFLLHLKLCLQKLLCIRVKDQIWLHGQVKPTGEKWQAWLLPWFFPGWYPVSTCILDA